jgi:hypothetical protein
VEETPCKAGMFSHVLNMEKIMRITMKNAEVRNRICDRAERKKKKTEKKEEEDDDE